MGGLGVRLRGHAGGYTLVRGAEETTVGSVLDALGGRFFHTQFCERHSGLGKNCAHVTDCSIRALWAQIQELLDSVLNNTTLKDLLNTQPAMQHWIGAQSGDLFPVV